MIKQKGQIQIIFGIAVVLVIIGVFFWAQFFRSKGPVEETVENSEDLSSPIRSNLLPTGILSADTKETNISLNTDEPGYCRFSNTPDKPYDSIGNRFSPDKKKTSFSAKVSGLKDGQTYKYYVRCQDLAGNKNIDDAVIEFSIGSSSASGSGSYIPSPASGKAPPVRSNLYPSGSLAAGTKKTTISLITNEPGYCRFSKEPGESYNSMDGRFSYNKEKTQHTVTVMGLTDNKIYEYYVRCRD